MADFDQITTLQATNIARNSLTLTWTVPESYGAPAVPEGYDVRFVVGGTLDGDNWDDATPITFVGNAHDSGQTESLLVTGLSPYVQYSFGVKLTGLLSNVATVYTEGYQSFNPVWDLLCRNATADSIDLRWTVPQNGLDFRVPDGYDIRKSTSPITVDNFGNAEAVEYTGLSLNSGCAATQQVSSLTDDTTYYFAIKALRSDSAPSPISNFAVGQTWAISEESPAPSNDPPLVYYASDNAEGPVIPSIPRYINRLEEKWDDPVDEPMEVTAYCEGSPLLRGCHVIVDVTDVALSPEREYDPEDPPDPIPVPEVDLEVRIDGIDAGTGIAYPILPPCPISETGTTVLRVYPGIIGVNTSTRVSDALPQEWQVVVAHQNVDIVTYSVSVVPLY